MLVKAGDGTYRTRDGLFTVKPISRQRECECLACDSGNPCPNDGVSTDKLWEVTMTSNGSAAAPPFTTLRAAKEWLSEGAPA